MCSKFTCFFGIFNKTHVIQILQTFPFTCILIIVSGTHVVRIQKMLHFSMIFIKTNTGVAGLIKKALPAGWGRRKALL